MTEAKNTDLQALLSPSERLKFGGEELVIEELTVDQTLNLLAMQDDLANLDFGNLAKAVQTNAPTLFKVLGIALGVDEARIRKAKNSELQRAVAAMLGLNKAFFLQAMQTLIAAVALKEQIQRQLQNQAAVDKTGAQPSQDSSNTATASGTSTNTLGDAS